MTLLGLKFKMAVLVSGPSTHSYGPPGLSVDGCKLCLTLLIAVVFLCGKNEVQGSECMGPVVLCHAQCSRLLKIPG